MSRNGKRDPQTELREGLVSGNVPAVRRLLASRDRPSLTGVDKYGRLPLHYACCCDDHDYSYVLTRVLLDQPPRMTPTELNKPDKGGRTAFLLACQHGHGETATLLLARGAANAVNTPDNAGMTPLHHACFGGHAIVTNLLLNPAITPAIYERKATRSQVQKADLTRLTKDGKSPLVIACQQGKEDVAEQLLRNEAVVNTQDKAGMGPLHHACSGGHESVVELLLDRMERDDAMKPNKDKETPLIIACKEGHTGITALLLQKGGDVSLSMGDKDGLLPLHHAAVEGRTDVTRLLLDWGADINGQDKGWCTPLHFACMNGRKDVVQLLLGRPEVAVDKRNGARETALDLAKQELATIQEERPSDVAAVADQQAVIQLLESWIASQVPDRPGLPRPGSSSNGQPSNGGQSSNSGQPRSSAQPSNSGQPGNGAQAGNGGQPKNSAQTNSSGQLSNSAQPSNSGQQGLPRFMRPCIPSKSPKIEGNDSIKPPGTQADRPAETPQPAVQPRQEPAVQPRPEPAVQPRPEPAEQPRPEPAVQPQQEPPVQPQQEPDVQPEPEHRPLPNPLGGYDIKYNNVLHNEVIEEDGLSTKHNPQGGWTSLHYACQSGENVSKMRIQGADVLKADNVGRIPMHIACLHNNVEAVQLLLNFKSADAHLQLERADSYGKTALHCACSEGYDKTAQLLLMRGASTLAKDKAGRTPKDCARERHRADVVRLLEIWMASKSHAEKGASEIVAQRAQDLEREREQEQQRQARFLDEVMQQAGELRASKDQELAEKERQLSDLRSASAQQLASKDQQLAEKESQLSDLKSSSEQQLQRKDQQMAEMERQLSQQLSQLTRLLDQGQLLKHPPVCPRQQRSCVVCMDPIPIGSIACAQKGCASVLCQGCAIDMCETRTRSSGSYGYSNGELLCPCRPTPHVLAPATLARVVPTRIFKSMQATLPREPVPGSWRSFMAQSCPDCGNTAAVSAGLPFFLCTSVQCANKNNIFCIFCQAPWTNGHECAASINISAVEEMLREEAAATDDNQLQNVLVRPCPRCPLRICVKQPDVCYHMTCRDCDLKYCGICPFINTENHWSKGHHCVDTGNIYRRSEPRRQAVLSAYQEAIELE